MLFLLQTCFFHGLVIQVFVKYDVKIENLATLLILICEIMSDSIKDLKKKGNYT